MFQKQLIGIAVAIPAFFVVLAVCRFAPQIFARAMLPSDDVADRLAYAARWLFWPGLTLLVGVVFAGRRGFIAGAIDGTRTPENYSLEINLRYNLNTLEQTALAAIAWTGLAIVLPHDRLVLIPAAAFLFVVGRATFWIGYLLYPMARAFGMVLTILPTLAAFGWLAWRMAASQ
jgi:hypothetical protein